MEAEEAPATKVRAPRRKGKLKFVLIGIAVLLVLAGGGVGFAIMRGLGPFGKKTVAAPVATKPKVAAKRVAPPVAPPTTLVRTLPPTTKVDPDEGAGRLAKLWNEVETPKLLAIAKDWRDPELARVATRMDAGKVAELLSAMPPKRASALSREMQRLASVVPIE